MAQHPLYHLYSQNRIIRIRKPLFPNHWVRVIDKIAFFIGIFGPFSASPQVYKIWVHHHAEGVSIITFATMFVFDLFLLAYAAAHREYLLVVMYALWGMMNVAIAIGVFIYG